MATPLPKVSVAEGIEIIEVDEGIIAAIDHGEWDRNGLHGLTLIDAYAGVQSLEHAAGLG